MARAKGKAKAKVVWQTVGASIRGASHVKHNLPNQDAYRLIKRDAEIVFAVSDGHGSKRCFRSHLGAQFAADSLAEVIEHYLPELRQALTDWVPENEEALKSGIVALGQPPLEILRRIAESTLKRWVQKVLNHLKQVPFQAEEVDALDYGGRRALGGNALLAYGATLMGGLVLDRHFIGINLGDGDLLVYTTKTVDHYKHSDGDMVADYTYSLCTSGSLAYWQYVIRSLEGVEAVLAATDGYRNSYRSLKGFEQVGTDLIKLSIKKGLSVIEAGWPGWLEETTRLGSGDDITAVLILANSKKEKKTLWR